MLHAIFNTIHSGQFYNIAYCGPWLVSLVSSPKDTMCYVRVTLMLWRFFLTPTIRSKSIQYSFCSGLLGCIGVCCFLPLNLLGANMPRSFVSFSIALYALVLFYFLTKENLAGKQALAKFGSVKLIVFFTFCPSCICPFHHWITDVSADQGFLFSILQSHGVIKATPYWTSTNVADGLQALCTCCEVLSLLFLVRGSRLTPFLDGDLRRPYVLVIRLKGLSCNA